MKWLMLLVTFILVSRQLFYLIFSLKFHVIKKDSGEGRFDCRNNVDVIIPAFNEGVCIANTLNALSNIFNGINKVIVVNDGSTDNTLEVLQGFQTFEITIVNCSTNMGKAEALNRGLTKSDSEWVLLLDSDTEVRKLSIEQCLNYADANYLSAALVDVYVKSDLRWVSEILYYDFVINSGLLKRAQSLLGIISTVPGCACFLKRELINRCGGLSADTLAEDTDLTITAQLHGLKLGFIPGQEIVTQVPQNFSFLVRQRFRWVYGNIQCLTKHNKEMLHHKKATVIWADMVFGNIIVPLMSILLFLSITKLLLSDWLLYVIGWYFVFGVAVFVGWIVTSKKRIGFLSLIAYPFVMVFVNSYASFKAIYAVAKRNAVSWEKQKRY